MSKTFNEKLREIMPPQPKPNTNGKAIFFESHPIRQSADYFFAYLQQVPANEREFIDALWVFGEMVAGDMEKRMNHALKIAQDAMSCNIAPIIVDLGKQ